MRSWIFQRFRRRTRRAKAPSMFAMTARKAALSGRRVRHLVRAEKMGESEGGDPPGVESPRVSVSHVVERLPVEELPVQRAYAATTATAFFA